MPTPKMQMVGSRSAADLAFEGKDDGGTLVSGLQISFANIFSACKYIFYIFWGWGRWGTLVGCLQIYSTLGSATNPGFGIWDIGVAQRGQLSPFLPFLIDESIPKVQMLRKLSRGNCRKSWSVGPTIGPKWKQGYFIAMFFMNDDTQGSTYFCVRCSMIPSGGHHLPSDLNSFVSFVCSACFAILFSVFFFGWFDLPCSLFVRLVTPCIYIYFVWLGLPWFLHSVLVTDT